MSRVVNTNRPGKKRKQIMRGCAELLRHLSQKPEIDDEARDMVAALVYCLQEIDETIEEAIHAWERRDYWVKSERFRQKWSWVGANREALTEIVKNEDWNQLPARMAELFPYFSSIKVVKFTRSSDLWKGKYAQLRKEI